MNRDSVNVCDRREKVNNYRTELSKSRGLKGERDGKALSKGVSQNIQVSGFLSEVDAYISDKAMAKRKIP